MSKLSASVGVPDREAMFWELMTKRRHPASAFRLNKVDLSSLGDQKVQPLEILVVDTLALLCPEVEWSATRVQGDGGVDFHGAAKVIRLAIRRKAVDFRYTIVGQVKRSRRYRMELLAATFTGMRDRVERAQITISQFLFVVSTQPRALERFSREAPRIGAHAFPGVPVSVLDADDLVWLWVQAGADTFDVLRPAFSDEEFAFLKAHLADLAARWRAPPIRCTVGPPVGRLIVGGDIELKVTIHTAAPAGRSIALQWLPGDDVDAIRPLSILASPMRATLSDRGEVQVKLKLRANAAGTIGLGELRVHLASGAGVDPRPALSTSLGELEISPDPTFRRVRFQRAPNAAAAETLDRLARSAASRRVEILAVLGPAGVGKSRLLDELFNRLHGTGVEEPAERLWTLFRVDHDAQRASRRFLKDCLVGLVFPEGEPNDMLTAAPSEAAFEWLKRFVGGESTALKAGIEALARRGESESEVEPAAFALLAAFIARLRDGPIALHLANMHWADDFEIDVLLEVIHRLRALEDQLPHGVFLILEGREGEMIDAVAGYDLTTDAWRRLHDDGEHCGRIVLHPWSGSQSRALLEELIEGVAARPLADEALQTRVVDHVLSCSQGNPLQMIEHLRLLIDNGRLQIAEDGSAIFDPPSQLPTALVTMIVARVEFINRTPRNGELVALLRLCAEVGLWVDADLFAVMAGSLSDARLLTTLAQWHVARLPGDSAPDFEFVHEAYRDAFRQAGWRAEDGARLRQALLARLAPNAISPAEHVIAWGRIMRLDPACDLQEVMHGLTRALERAADPQAQIAICRELIGLPRHLFAEGPGWPALALRLIDLLLMHGDWNEALLVIERVDRADAALSILSPVEQAEFAHRAGNILGDLDRVGEGLRAVRRGLATLQRATSGPRSPQERALVDLLHNRLGVLLWFSGRLDEGISHQFRAFRSARRDDPGGERELLLACELGTALCARHPKRALKLLDRAAHLYRELAGRCDPSLDYVLVQREMVRLAGDPASAAEVLKALRAFLDADVARSAYAEALAWLTLGGAELMLGARDGAKAMFAEAIAAATRCRSPRLMWKAHLAFATATAGQGPRGIGHARYAGRLLAQSLDYVEPGYRDRWEGTARLPLEHARRLAGPDPVIDAALERIDGGVPPAWVGDWASRPEAINRSGAAFQVLHIRSGPDDIFLMG